MVIIVPTYSCRLEDNLMPTLRTATATPPNRVPRSASEPLMSVTVRSASRAAASAIQSSASQQLANDPAQQTLPRSSSGAAVSTIQIRSTLYERLQPGRSTQLNFSSVLNELYSLSKETASARDLQSYIERNCDIDSYNDAASLKVSINENKFSAGVLPLLEQLLRKMNSLTIVELRTEHSIALHQRNHSATTTFVHSDFSAIATGDFKKLMKSKLSGFIGFYTPSRAQVDVSSEGSVCSSTDSLAGSLEGKGLLDVSDDEFEELFDEAPEPVVAASEPVNAAPESAENKPEEAKLRLAIKLVQSQLTALRTEQNSFWYKLMFFHQARKIAKIDYCEKLIEFLKEKLSQVKAGDNLQQLIKDAHDSAVAANTTNPEEITKGGSYFGTSRLLAMQRLLGIDSAWKEGKSKVLSFPTSSDFHGLKGLGLVEKGDFNSASVCGFFSRDVAHEGALTVDKYTELSNKITPPSSI